MFTTSIAEIRERVAAIDPVKYAKTRNYTDGAVTKLSPYISRGVISTNYVLRKTLARYENPSALMGFIQELAWREYFQRVWQEIGERVNEDVKQSQTDVENHGVSRALIKARTGVEAVDEGIRDLYENGYLHNHLRMYTASIACNIAKSHWLVPAKWMYFYLLDADWASNALSWQWTAGAFSKKKYYANQENINKFCGTHQKDTFLDVEYSEFEKLPIPEVLKPFENPPLRTILPENGELEISNHLPSLIYNFYNLDPAWRAESSANRILLLEPSHFEKYPISEKTLNFILKLGENIENLQIFVGEFADLSEKYGLTEVYFKEHPTNLHYKGFEDERDWMFPELRGYFPSFFNYWKKCEKLLRKSF